MNSFTSRIALCIVTCSALAASSHAQIKKVSGGYEFRMKFVSGRQYNYTLKSKFNMASSGFKMDISGPVTMKTLSASGDSAQVQASLGPLSAGNKVVSPKQTVKFKQDRFGNVSGAGSVQQMSVQLPKKPVNPGASWTAQTGVQTMGAATKVTAKYTFVGMKNLAGHQVAQIKVSYKSTGGTSTSGTGTVYLLAEDCSLYSTTTSLTLQIGDKSGDVSMAMSRK